MRLHVVSVSVAYSSIASPSSSCRTRDSLISTVISRSGKVLTVPTAELKNVEWTRLANKPALRATFQVRRAGVWLEELRMSLNCTGIYIKL